MNRKLFTEEQQQLLRQNPYIYSVTETRITLTQEFKELFMTAYTAGESPRKILEDHGFAMGYNYNGKLKSSEILLHEDGSFEMIRRAETPKDYFATFDCFPIYEKLLEDVK